MTTKTLLNHIGDGINELSSLDEEELESILSETEYPFKVDSFHMKMKEFLYELKKVQYKAQERGARVA